MSYPVKTRLTDAMVTKFPYHPSGQKMIADTGQPGLYLMVRKTSKKFAAQREIRIMGEDMKPKRKTVRRMLKANTVADARTETIYVLAEIEKGEVGNRPDGSITLRESWARYKSALEKTGKSPATIYGYRNAVETEHLLGIWLDTPLRDLATSEGMKIVAARHEAITLGKTGESGGGSYAANGAMRTLRAIYNWCLSRGFVKPDPDGNFPTRQIVFNPEEARRRSRRLGQDYKKIAICDILLLHCTAQTTISMALVGKACRSRHDSGLKFILRRLSLQQRSFVRGGRARPRHAGAAGCWDKILLC